MASNSQTTTLDHIQEIVVPGNVFDHPSNEYWALTYLRKGLDFLFQQAKMIDLKTRKDIQESLSRFPGSESVSVNNLQMNLYRNFPGSENIPKDLLTCAFHWYAVSACQYAKTVATIAYSNGNACPKPKEYVENVMPEILTYRDKIAAHFAWTTRNSADNEAERLASIIPQLSFIDDSWHVGSLLVKKTRNKKTTSTSGKIKPWSISLEHLKLAERYWPETLQKL